MKKIFNITILICIMTIILTGCKKQEEKFIRVGDMNVTRANHQSIVLKDGRILILGGYTENYKSVKEIEIYNPITEKFTLINKKLDEGFEEALLLNNGKVVIFYNKGLVFYDPIKNSFSSIIKMLIPRTNFSCILLKNNKIFVKGGIENSKSQLPPTINEIYDPKSSSFKFVKSNELIKKYYDEPYYLKVIHNKNKMNILRTNFLSIPLYNGNILVIGGYDKYENYILKSEIFNSETQNFMFTGSMNFSFAEYYSAYYLSPVISENILISGKDINNYRTANAELYNVNTGKFRQIKNKIFDRLYPNIACIKNNMYLITGGSRQKYTEDDFIKTYKDAYILKLR